MLRYALDNLGWYEFEGLAQTLLKARLGLGVEAWGGTGDWGRDAYYDGQLTYPTREQGNGPFVFQCKFVANANAAGAKPAPQLLTAVRAEAKRLASMARATTPAHYVLLTNVRVGGPDRKRIATELAATLPNARVHVHDGRDLCAWLDLSPEVAKAFPLLWSLRDLHQLLRVWVNADVLSRSRAALEEAEEIAHVFVPTRAYSRALEVLAKHFFVVLEGPPEMGKTAIGRMISLSMVARGWEAVECRGPLDVERNYDAQRYQVFVADDFFGRTEYDTRRVSEWERELQHVVRLLDARHWLVLTTRAHLLNLAKQQLDIPGRARQFPAPGEVVVDASELQEVEKGRMLYRHLKHRALSEGVRLALRGCARSIVRNPHFTPERVRRLVADDLRELAQGAGQISHQEILRAAEAMLREPTQQMRATFRKLRSAEKWLLFALVEAPADIRDSGDAGLRDAYARLCPAEDLEPYSEVLAAMSDAFVRRLGDSGRVDWIHPSCRDLTISELGRERKSRRHFLANCSAAGLRLALSVGGGGDGAVAFPLLQASDDWAALAQHACRSVELLTETLTAAHQVAELASLQGSPSAARLRDFLMRELWPTARLELNRVGWSTALAALYCEKEVYRHSPNGAPDLSSLWDDVLERSRADATNTTHVIWDRLTGLHDLALLAHCTEPFRLDRSNSRADDLVVALTTWATVIEEEYSCSYDETQWRAQERSEISDGYAVLASAMDMLRVIAAARPWATLFDNARRHFQHESERLLDDEEPPYSDDDREPPDVDRDADIDEMFKDL